MGKKDPAQTTTTTLVDPITAARQKQQWEAAQKAAGTPYQPYTGEGVAPINQDMMDSYAAARTAAGTGQSQIAQGNDIYSGLGNFSASKVAPGLMDSYTADGGDPVSASMINAGQFGGGNIPQVSAGGVSAPQVTSKNFTDYDLSKYMNPFIGNVVDTTLADLDRQRQKAIQQGQAAAGAAGAYGGSRHGVADAATNEAALRAGVDASGKLRSQGFDTAAGLITGDANRDLTAGVTNANNGTQAGIASMQAMLDAQKANAGNALTGQGLSLSAQQSNAGNKLSADTTSATLAQQLRQFNAQQKQAASQFNVGNDLTAQTVNAGNEVAGAGVRGSAASGLIAGGQAAQSAAGKGSDLLNRIGLQQQGQQQNQDTFDYNQWLAKQQDPFNKLSWLNGFTGTPGQTSVSTQTGGSNPLGQIAGAAATVLPFLL